MARRFLTQALMLMVLVVPFMSITVHGSTPTFYSCWLLWEGPDDLGYTYTFNQNRRSIDDQLQAKYPNYEIESYAAFNVFFMTQDEANATVFDFVQGKRCNAIVVADSYLLPTPYYNDGGVSLATQYPNISWIVIDDFIAGDHTNLPNLIWGTTTWGAHFWVAGATASAQAGDGAVCFVSAYESGFLTPPESVTGFTLGVRAVNKTKPIYVMTMNNWYWDGAEQLAAKLLVDLGCRVIARYLDARFIDVWVNQNPDRGTMSIGTHGDIASYVGDSVLVSCLEDYSKIFTIFDSVVKTNSIGNPYPLVMPVKITGLSPLASEAARSTFTWALANAPDDWNLVCGPHVTHSSKQVVNYTQPNGCLTPFERFNEYIYDAHTTYFTFSNGLDCPNGTYYEYSLPDLTLSCLPCPANTYRPPEQTAAGTSCTPCPAGFISSPGATICTQPQKTAADYWYVFLIVGLLLVGALGAVGARQYRVYALGAVRPLNPNVPFAIAFVGLKNEHELQELGDANVGAILEKLSSIVRKAAREHKCFEARRIDAGTVMVVSKTATDAVLFAESVMEAVVKLVPWREEVVTHPVQQVARGARKARRLRRLSRETESTVSNRKDPKTSSPHTDKALREDDRGSSRQTTTRSDTHSWISRRTHTINVDTIVPKIYIGMHFGVTAIEVDEEHNTVSYHGDCIKIAAGIADVAVGGQILMSSETADAVDLEQLTTRPTGKFVVSGKRMETTVVNYASLRLSEEHHRQVARAAARVSDSEEGVLGNAIAKADGRLLRRRIAVVSMHVPQLSRDFKAAVDFDGALDIIEQVHEVANENFGEIHSIQDGIVVVTIGVGRSVSLLPVRAVSIAHQLEHIAASIGIHIGAGIVGKAGNGCAAALGRVAAGATVMRLVSGSANVKVVSSGACYSDLYPAYFIATVDAVPLPWEPESKPLRAVAVGSSRDQGRDEEWLYSFDKKSVLETAWTQLLEGHDATLDAFRQQLEGIEVPKAEGGEADDKSADPQLLYVSRQAMNAVVSAMQQADVISVGTSFRRLAERRYAAVVEWVSTQSTPVL